MSEQTRVLENALLHTLGRVLSIIIGIFSIALTTRLLAPEGFGVLTTAISYLQLFGILMDIGLTLSITQQLSSEPDSQHAKTIGNTLTLRLLVSVIALIFAFAILPLFNYSPTVNINILIGSILFALYSFQQIFTSVFQYLSRSGIIVITELSGKFLTLLITVFAWYRGGSVLTIMLSYIAGALVTALLMALVSRRVLPWRLNWDSQLWKKMLSISWPIGISIAFNLIYFKADTVILSLYFPAYIIGLYGASYKILEVLIALPPLLLGLLLPKLTSAWKNQNTAEFCQWFQWGFDTILLVTVPLVVGGIAVANELILLVAGKEFIYSAVILQILLIAVGIIYCSSLFGYSVVALNQQKKMIWGYGVTAIVSLIGYFALIPSYGMLGAAWMTVASELLIAVLTFSVIKRVTKIRLDLSLLSKYVFAAIIMYSGIELTRNYLSALPLITEGAIIYAVTLILIGGFDISKIKQLHFWQSI